MPAITEFQLNLASPDYATIAGQTGDLVIYESGVSLALDGTVEAGNQTLDTAEIAALQAEGRTVIAYVNVCVTDHLRAYWNDAWVDAPDAANGDVGTVTAEAPAWLQANHGYANDGGVTTFGYIVDYTDAAWQAQVIANAVHMVTAAEDGGLGLDGVFLDDVGRYYQAASNDPNYSATEAAQDMLALVNAIAAAVLAVNPDAYIAVNGGAYLAGDAGFWSGDAATQAAALALWAEFQSGVDALMMESQYNQSTQSSTAWSDAQITWDADTDFLSVEHATVLTDGAAYVAWAQDAGVIAHLAADNSYSLPAVTPSAATGAGDTLSGGDGPNHLLGGAGNDLLSGLGGDDTLDGGSGNDTIYGGDGDDVIYGISGADQLYGGAGDDTITGGTSNDLLSGDAGADYLKGNGGHDTLYGGDGADTLYGQTGDDLVLGGADADRVYGQAGNDTLDGGAGADTLSGGTGADVLLGGLGRDVIYAGADSDADLFVFTDAAESARGSARDVLVNFTRGSDLIDLHLIDADTTTTAEDAFAFIGTAGFGHTAGELRYISGSNYVLVQADLDGDGRADMEMRVNGLSVLDADDFLL